MAGFIEVHPKNSFQGLLLVNVDDIKHVYPLTGDGSEKCAVLRFQGPDLKPIDLNESYEEVKHLIALALEKSALTSLGFRTGPHQRSVRTQTRLKNANVGLPTCAQEAKI